MRGKVMQISGKIVLSLTIVSLLLVFGNNCSGIRANKFDVTQFQVAPGIDTFGTGEIQGVSGEKTISFASFALIQDLFVNLMNSQLPAGQTCSNDANIILAFETNKGAFSLDGAANSYSAEMQMAVIKMAAAVALCGIQKNAKFLEGTTVTSAVASIDSAKVAAIAQNVSMVFWGGKYDAALLPQLDLLVSDIKSNVKTGAGSSSATQQVLVGLVTSIMASFWGIEV